MSSSDFKRVLIRDERLDAKESIPFAVYKSGQNVTVAPFNAVSESASSHTYNIQVPSETTIIDRRVMWESTVTFKVTGTYPNPLPAGTVAPLQYASTEALGPFPLHSLCSTIQVTINNNSVSTNMNDILPALLTFYDRRELNRYNSLSPMQRDAYRNYADGVAADNNVLGGWSSQDLDNDFQPRGSFCDVQFSGNAASFDASVAANATAPVAGAAFTYWVRATVREPLLVSPFSYAHPYVNGQGFYGIQNLNFVMNIISDKSSGIWRSGSAWGSTLALSDMSFANSRLIFNFLSPKPSDMLSARNVVPYWEMPRYLTTNVGSVAAATLNGNKSVTNAVATIQSNTIQLNQIPDKLIVFLRRPRSARDCTTTDSSLYISKISVSFNNQSGILASATSDQLYRYTYEAGSNLTWAEYKACGVSALSTGTGAGVWTPLCGSYLMLDMGRHVQITEDYYAPGSLGNFNLQFTITVENTDTANAYNNLEVVLITLNSGIFVCEKGQSATYTGILTKDDVLSVSGQDAINEREAARMVGGFGLNQLKSLVMPLAKKFAPAIIEKASGAIGSRFGEDAGKLAGVLGKAASKKYLGEGYPGGGSMKGCGKGAGSYNAISDRLV